MQCDECGASEALPPRAAARVGWYLGRNVTFCPTCAPKPNEAVYGYSCRVCGCAGAAVARNDREAFDLMEQAGWRLATAWGDLCPTHAKQWRRYHEYRVEWQQEQERTAGDRGVAVRRGGGR